MRLRRRLAKIGINQVEKQQRPKKNVVNAKIEMQALQINKIKFVFVSVSVCVVYLFM